MLLQTLIKTRELLSDPSHWTQDAYARTKKGHPIGWGCDNASCFCLSGAVRRQENDPNALAFLRTMLAEKWPDRSYPSVPQFNDHPSTTHAMVLELLDYAIERVPQP